MFSFITAFFSALSNAFKGVSQRDAELNTTTEQANAQAQQIQVDKEAGAKEVAPGADLESLERDVS
jgi:hypothetical protein